MPADVLYLIGDGIRTALFALWTYSTITPLTCGLTYTYTVWITKVYPFDGNEILVTGSYIAPNFLSFN
jgi:hypothetical protein